MSSQDKDADTPEGNPVDLLLATSADSSGSLSDVLERGLAHATAFFGLDFGIVSRVEGDRYVIEHVHQPEGAGLEVGQEFPLGDTCCAITLEASDVISIDEMRSSNHSNRRCHEKFQIESYIGVPLRVDGEIHGTLNFSAPDARPRAWSETDRQLVLLLARWVEGTIAEAGCGSASHRRTASSSPATPTWRASRATRATISRLPSRTSRRSSASSPRTSRTGTRSASPRTPG